MAGAGRTAIGNFSGSLASLSASEITSQLTPQVLTKYEINPALIGEVILGQVFHRRMWSEHGKTDQSQSWT